MVVGYGYDGQVAFACSDLSNSFMAWTCGGDPEAKPARQQQRIRVLGKRGRKICRAGAGRLKAGPCAPFRKMAGGIGQPESPFHAFAVSLNPGA